MLFLDRCASVDAEQLWVWEYVTEDGNHDLFMDINEEIRFRVIDEEFVDLTPEGPTPPKNPDGETTSMETKKSPYTISVYRFCKYYVNKVFATLRMRWSSHILWLHRRC